MLNAEQYQRVKALFLEADSLASEEREQVFARAGAEDPSVGAELRRLFELEPAAACFMERPLEVSQGELLGAPIDSSAIGAHALRSLAESEAMPTSIGQYTIVRRLGVGGMGAVYEARQDQPKRVVAVKIIRTGLASESTLRRFQFEAEVLARLDHASIAHIYDAGLSDIRLEDGVTATRPFFVMELVRGKSLTDYAREHDLSLRRRLMLLAEVCDAVQHAHQKGVIHRDLKPGNILIGDNGQPKILDFGVARATDADVQTATVRTAAGQLVGTIPYMSPEQLRGESSRLDVRADVYALGVILYELLADRLPHDVNGCSVAEALRRIDTTEPARLANVDSDYRGDLDTIVHTALEREVNRRYQSAAELAADLRRFVADQPIAARPASTIYLFRKFAKRNRALVAGVVVAVAALVVGTTISVWQAVRATREAEQRALALDESEAVLAFLTDTLMSADPARLGRDVLVTDVLEQASVMLDTWADRPRIAGRIHEAVGSVYLTLGELDPAEEHLNAALGIYAAEFGEVHERTGVVLRSLGILAGTRGNLDQDEELTGRALEILRATVGPAHVEYLLCLSDYATNAAQKHDNEEAERRYREAVAGSELALGPEDSNTLEIKRVFGGFLSSLARYDEALEVLEPTTEALRRSLGDDHPSTLKAMRALAGLYSMVQRFDESEELYVSAIEGMKRVFGDEYHETLQAMNNLASLYTATGRIEKASETYLELTDLCSRAMGPEHRHTLVVRTNLADSYVRLGRLDEAEPLLVDLIEVQRRVVGERDPFVAAAINALADLRVAQGDNAAAEPLFAEVAAIYAEKIGPEHPMTGKVRLCHGGCLARLKRFEEAETELLDALAIFRANGGDDSAGVQAVAGTLAPFYDAWGKPEEAVQYRELLLAPSECDTTP